VILLSIAEFLDVSKDSFDTTMILTRVRKNWARLWMRCAGPSPFGKLATRLAALSTPPYYGRYYLARLNQKGYISPNATIHHRDFHHGSNVFIDDHVLIYQDRDGGSVGLGESVYIHRDTIIQTGSGGSVTMGSYSFLQPRCQLSAYKAQIRIGSYVQISPNCAFYPYDHGMAPGELMSKQPLQTKGGIVIEDDAWLGFGVIVLDGVTIGSGAVIGAGSVVTSDIPASAIAVGVPARVVKMRNNLG